MSTILVVDDRPSNREFLVKLLGYGGHRLLEAGDGAEALELTRRERPDLVITDCIMPTMDGFEFVRRLRADPGAALTPVIIYTAGYREAEAQVLASKIGVARVIAKPSEPEAILAAVNTALGAPGDVRPPAVPDDFGSEHLRLMTDKLSQKVVELEQANRSLEGMVARLRLLHYIDRGILAANSIEGLAAAALAHIQELRPFERATVSIFDFAAGEVRDVACFVAGRPAEGIRAPLSAFGRAGEGIAVLRRGERLRIDLSEHASESAILRQVVEGGAPHFEFVPLLAEGELIGTLNLGSRSAEPLPDELVEVVLEVAAQLAVAVRQAQLGEEVRRHTAELERRVEERTAELRELNAQLESFNYSISHDLRNPLVAISGFARLLEQKHGSILPADALKMVGKICAASDRMDSMIEGLLACSRISRAELELGPVHLDGLVKNVLHLVGDLLEERHASLTIDRPLPRVLGHELVLTQVLSNLLSNAAKYVAPEVRPVIRVWSEERGDLIRLWVEDNGIGIAPKYHERIFRVFERLPEAQSYAGTGVGLAIVQRAVQRVGGAIGVESEPGKGSRFWVDLRRAERSA